MAEKEYSINEKLNLLREVTCFYETLCEKDKRLINKYKVLKISKRIIDDELKENKRFTQNELNSITRGIIDAITQEENLNINKHENEEKERIKAGLGELIGIISGNHKIIQSLKKFMKEIKQMTFKKENRELEIKKIISNIKNNFLQ